MKKMKAFFTGLVLTLVAVVLGFIPGGIGIMLVNYKNEPRLVELFFNPPSHLDLEKDRSVLVAFVKPTLPKVTVHTLNIEQVLCEAEGSRIQKLVSHYEIYRNYPKREKNDEQKREPAMVHLNDVYKWLSEPAFFHPKGLEGVEQRVVDAKEHLNYLFQTGKYKRLLSIEQIMAIICMEVYTDEGEFLVDLNCLGDLDWSGYGKAHGLLQISDRAYLSLDATKEFGLIGPDFLGDLALSELFIQAWFWEHTHHEGKFSSFEWRARCWNKGPTGAMKNGRGHVYFFGNSDRRGVQRFLTEVVQNLPAVKQHSANEEIAFSGEVQIIRESGGEIFSLPTRF